MTNKQTAQQEPWHRVRTVDLESGDVRYKRVEPHETEGHRVHRRVHRATVDLRADDIMAALALYREVIRMCPHADFPDVHATVTLQLDGVSDEELAALKAVCDISRSVDVSSSVYGTYYTPKQY